MRAGELRPSHHRHVQGGPPEVEEQTAVNVAITVAVRSDGSSLALSCIVPCMRSGDDDVSVNVPGASGDANGDAPRICTDPV